MLISPASPLFPLVATGFFIFFGLLGRLPPTSLLLVEAVELAGRVGPEGTLLGGGIASETDDAVRDTEGCRIPLVVVGRLDITLSRL